LRYAGHVLTVEVDETTAHLRPVRRVAPERW